MTSCFKQIVFSLALLWNEHDMINGNGTEWKEKDWTKTFQLKTETIILIAGAFTRLLVNSVGSNVISFHLSVSFLSPFFFFVFAV